MFENLEERGFDVLALHHASAILSHDLPNVAVELAQCLSEFTIPVAELVAGGGGEAKGTQRLRNKLYELDWPKHVFHVERTIDGVSTESLTHEIDHVRRSESAGTIALEIEWNNKDPFFDRDLENFKRLHADGAISVGVIITRGSSLHENLTDIILNFATNKQIQSLEDLEEFGYLPTPKQRRRISERYERTGDFARSWAEIFVSDKFGQATTHWRKLIDRVNRGVGNPCPLLLIGIPRSAIDEN